MRVAQGWLLLSIAAAPYAAATRVSGVKLSGDGNLDGVIDPRVANAPPRAVDPQTCPAVTPRACVLSDTVPAWRSWLGWWRFDLGDCTALDLGSSGLGDRAALALASALAFDGHVVHGGVLMPAKAVSRRRCREGGIQQLSLFNNSIGDAGVAALASAISRHAVLTTLNLRANAIGPEGALALAAALEHNDALETLDVSENAIATRGALALAAALAEGKNARLRYLSAALNGVAVEGRIALANAVKQSATLQTVVHTHRHEALANWDSHELAGEGGGTQAQ